jgi:hypothetical protein
MGKGERSRAENQAHNICGWQKEDRGGTAGKVDAGEGGEEEGGLGPRELAAQMRQAFVLEVDCSVPICVIPHL